MTQGVLGTSGTGGGPISLYFDGDPTTVTEADVAIVFAISQGIRDPEEIVVYATQVLEEPITLEQVTGAGEDLEDLADISRDGRVDVEDAAIIFLLQKNINATPKELEAGGNDLLGRPIVIGKEIVLPGPEATPFPARTIEFASESFAVVEGDGSAEITINRTGEIGRAASVRVNLADGTATAGEDYEATSSNVVEFAVGESSQTILIPIVADTLAEADETIQLTLANPTGGAILGALTEATLTISDDDDTAVAFTEELGLKPRPSRVTLSDTR